MEIIDSNISTSPKEITPFPSVESHYIYKEELEELKELIKTNKNILLWGPDGIGKRRLAAQLYNEIKENYDACGWYIYHESLNHTLTEQTIRLYSDTNSNLSAISIKRCLFQKDLHNLIFIENVNNECIQENSFKSFIGRKNITFICMSKLPEIDGFTSIKINPLSRMSCINLFKLYAPLEDDLAGKFVDLVQCHTFTVELLAKSFPKEFLSKPEEYYHLLENKLKDQSISECLKILFNSTQLSEEEKQILYYFAIMPSMFIPLEVTDWIQCKIEDLNELCHKGWLKDHGSFYSIHSMIREMILLEQDSFPEDFGKAFVQYVANKQYTGNIEIACSILDHLRLNKDITYSKAYFHLAKLYFNQYKYKEAEMYLKKALSMDESPVSNYTASIYSNLADSYHGQSKYEEAKECYKKAITILEQLEAYSAIIQLCNKFARLCFFHDHYEEIECYKKILAIYEKTTGLNDINAAKTYYDLAQSYECLHKYEEAKACLNKCIEIRKQVLGDVHQLTLEAYNALADMYENQNQLKEAEEIYQEILDLCIEKLGDDHAYTCFAYKELALLYENKAIENYKKALAILEKNHNIDRSELKFIQSRLNKLDDQ